MADCVQRFAQEIVNSDYFWSRLDADGKINMLRRSMGLPINPKSGQIQWCDGLEEKESRTIFVKIHQVEYLISWEVLNQVFSSIGDIEVIEIFDKDFHYHSRIRFKNGDSVIKAFDSLNGRCIYDDCCRMELFVDGRANGGLIENESSVEMVTSDRVKQTETPIEDVGHLEEIMHFDHKMEKPAEIQIDLNRDIGVPPSDKAEIEIPNSGSEADPNFGASFMKSQGMATTEDMGHNVLIEETNRDSGNKILSLGSSLKGNSFFPEFPSLDRRGNMLRGRMKWIFDPGGIENLTFQVLGDSFSNGIFKLQSVTNAQELFEKMSEKGILTIGFPSELKKHLVMIFSCRDVVGLVELCCDFKNIFGSIGSFNFDPGGALSDGKHYAKSTFADVLVTTGRELEGLVFVYDPGMLKQGECVLFPSRLLQASFLKEENQIKDKGVKEKASLDGTSSYLHKGICTEMFVFDPGIVNRENGEAARIGVDCIIQLRRLHSQQEIRQRDIAAFATGLALVSSRVHVLTEAAAKKRLQWDPGGKLMLMCVRGKFSYCSSYTPCAQNTSSDYKEELKILAQIDATDIHWKLVQLISVQVMILLRNGLFIHINPVRSFNCQMGKRIIIQ